MKNKILNRKVIWQVVTQGGQLLNTNQIIVSNPSLVQQLASGKATLATIQGQQVLIRAAPQLVKSQAASPATPVKVNRVVGSQQTTTPATPAATPVAAPATPAPAPAQSPQVTDFKSFDSHKVFFTI